MIDYEKLRIVHNLTLKTDYGFMHKIICARWNANAVHQVFELMHPLQGSTSYEHIEDLIAYLQSFLAEQKSEPKYKVGQRVHWVDIRNALRCNVIDSITQDERGIMYHFSEPQYGACYEIDTYPSRQSLIEARIAYWNGLLGEESERQSRRFYK